MMDALIEIALDVGGELLEAAIGYGLGRRKKKEPDFQPWDRKNEKLPWES